MPNTNLIIVADSHGSIDRLKNLYKNIDQKNITYVLHCGDCFVYGFEDILASYPHIHTWIARGNCDTNPEIEEKVQKLKNVTCQEVLHLELKGIPIGASHIQGIAQNKLKNKPIEIFCHGHTHRLKIEKNDKKIVLNPGALTEDGTYFLLSLPDLTLKKHIYSDIL